MELTLERFQVPLKRPLSTAAGELTSRDGFLVIVEENGTYGLGEATPLPGWTESLERCEEALTTAVGQLPDTGPVDVLQDLTATPAARHGLQLAIADLRARQADRPLRTTLAEQSVSQIPVNATIGDVDTPAAVAHAQAAVDEGFETIKLKVGGRSLRMDQQRVNAVRDAIGEVPKLRVDANGAWTMPQARRALEWLAAADVEYLEQPLAATALNEHAKLRGRGVDIAVDETLAEQPIDAIVSADAADVLICKPMVLGGIDQAFAAGQRARAAGIEPVVTTTIDAAIARTAAAHLACALDPEPACGLATGALLTEDIRPDPTTVTDGVLQVPDRPGLGIPQ